jgi:hypothetical protein
MRNYRIKTSEAAQVLTAFGGLGCRSVQETRQADPLLSILCVANKKPGRSPNAVQLRLDGIFHIGACKR